MALYDVFVVFCPRALPLDGNAGIMARWGILFLHSVVAFSAIVAAPIRLKGWICLRMNAPDHRSCTALHTGGVDA